LAEASRRRAQTDTTVTGMSRTSIMASTRQSSLPGYAASLIELLRPAYRALAHQP
jgi:hypothetical protein